MSASLQAINCTQCGAGLSVLGGHRVRAQVCGYCGAVLDAQEDYRVLQRYRNMVRPDTPFRIGMTGRIMNVDFTIIGVIGMSTRQEGETYAWVDHQLYSPTHGYCWLTYNQGDCVFSRKIRETPEPPSAQFVPYKGCVTLRGRSFRKLESYVARVDFCEGEFTWIPRIGDAETVDDTIAPPFMLSFVTRDKEIEYELGEYLDPDEARRSFGAAPAQFRPSDVHPARPFRPGALHQTLAMAGGLLFVLPLVLYFVLLAMANERQIAQQTFRDMVRPGTVDFDVANPDQLLELELAAPIENSWAYYVIAISPQNEEQGVAEFGREISFYTGYDDGPWREGSQTATARFKLPAGSYRLEVSLEEAEGMVASSGNSSRFSPARWPLAVTVREGVIMWTPLVGLSLLFAILGLSLPVRWFLFERRRWADDDDDD